MSEYKSDQEIYDQFADAATELMMRQYAKAAGKTVMKSAPMQKTSGELDEKRHKLIKKHLRNQQIKTVSKMVLRYSKVAAMFVLMLFGVVAILFTTVEAVRVPIINFFIEQKEGYLEISGAEGEKKPSEERETTAKNPLDGLLPEGYELASYEEYPTGGFTAIYRNTENGYILLSERLNAGSMKVDNENASTEHLTILSYEAVLIGKEEYQLVWLNSDNEQIYRLKVNALSREEIIKLAENIEKTR